MIAKDIINVSALALIKGGLEKKGSVLIAPMKNENIEINIEIFTGSENFTVYTMDFTKKYVEINADYRS